MQYDYDPEFGSLMVRSLAAIDFITKERVTTAYRRDYNEVKVDTHEVDPYAMIVYPMFRSDGCVLVPAIRNDARLRYIATTRHGLILAQPVDNGRAVWRVGDAPLEDNEIDLSTGPYAITQPITIVAARNAVDELAATINELTYRHRQLITVELRDPQPSADADDDVIDRAARALEQARAEADDVIARARELFRNLPADTDMENQHA